MRRFMLDCRAAAGKRGFPIGAATCALLAGINTHRGIPLDILAAAFVLSIFSAVALPGYVLGERLRKARRRT
jgi:predicted small secreted protein